MLFRSRRSRDWRSGRAALVDAYDAKAEAMALLAAAGAPVDNLQVLAGTSATYHPGRSGRLCLGPKTVLAEFGELHPALLKRLDLAGPAVAAELYLDAVPARRGTAGERRRPSFAPPPLQAVTRDFAFLLPADAPADALLRAVRGADKAAITGVALFDVFTGAGVPEGCKSLAIEVTLQPGDKSFSHDELEAIAGRIIAAAAKAGARLRD